jgi:hypothetical protein
MLCVAFLFAGCGGSTTNNAPPNTAKKDNTAKPDAAKTDTAKTDVAPTGEKTGVPECDEYIEKYEACLTSIAEKYPQVHTGLKDTFEKQRKGFKDAASTPQGKAALGPQCKQFIDSAKQATSTAYGCKW